ncbi:hypothetical protein JTB14_009225 [Gonioctena quinquepunctata]|nr:hypothetical protein JTB14_009225 [Gonioctena quinquepunctata]
MRNRPSRSLIDISMESVEDLKIVMRHVLGKRDAHQEARVYPRTQEGNQKGPRSPNKRTEIERKRLALETERARAELLMRKQELDNEMKILQLKQELAEAVFEEDADCDEGKNESFCMQWANNIILHNEDSKLVELNISSAYNDAKIHKMSNGRPAKNLSLLCHTVLMKEYCQHPHLQDLPIHDMINAKPTILIGQDNINLTVARKVRQSPDDRGLLATK